MLTSRNSTYTCVTAIIVATFAACLGCGSESDLQARKDKGAEDKMHAKPAQEQRANHSAQKPGAADEHGAPSTKTLVQWTMQTTAPEGKPTHHELGVALTIGGTQTTLEAGSAQGSCAVQPAHGELGRLRCSHDGTGHDFIIEKEGGGLTVYRKDWNESAADNAQRAKKKVARVSLAPETEVVFKDELAGGNL